MRRSWIRQEFELIGERQADGHWQCTLNHYPGGTVNVSMPVRGDAIATFIADSSEQAKQLAENKLAELQKQF